MTKQHSSNPNPGNGLLNKREAAAKLGLSERAVNYRMADGSLPYIKFGPRAVRFLSGDLDAFIEAHRIGG